MRALISNLLDGIAFELPRWMTGGRPMDRLCFCFRDVVVGRSVYMFQDRYGRKWLAYGRWSWTRVPTMSGPEVYGGCER